MIGDWEPSIVVISLDTSVFLSHEILLLGVVVGGSEYTFGSGSGIFTHQPRDVPGMAQFREAIDLGEYNGSSRDIDSIISELRSHFGSDSYNLLLKNQSNLVKSCLWGLD